MDFILMLLTCFVLSITLCVVFLFKNKVHTKESEIYSILVFSNVIGVVLETSCIYLSNRYLDSIIYDVIMHFYLIYIMAFLTILLFYLYSIYLTEETLGKYKVAQKCTLVAFVIGSVLTIFLPVEKHIGYATGPAVNLIYIYSSIIFIATIVVILLSSSASTNFLGIEKQTLM